jgi:hypothetical protein
MTSTTAQVCVDQHEFCVDQHEIVRSLQADSTTQAGEFVLINTKSDSDEDAAS